MNRMWSVYTDNVMRIKTPIHYFWQRLISYQGFEPSFSSWIEEMLPWSVADSLIICVRYNSLQYPDQIV